MSVGRDIGSRKQDDDDDAATAATAAAAAAAILWSDSERRRQAMVSLQLPATDVRFGRRKKHQ